jgi:hypothetical protein
VTNTGGKNRNSCAAYVRNLIGAVAVCTLSVFAVWAPASAQQYTAPAGPLTVDATNIAAGDSVTVAGSGFAANSTVEVVLVFEAPSSNGFASTAARNSKLASEGMLGESTADASGRFSADVMIPANFDGTGVLEARGSSSDGAVRVMRISIVNGAVSSLPATGAGASTLQVAWIAGFVVAAGALLALIGHRASSRRAW